MCWWTRSSCRNQYCVSICMCILVFSSLFFNMILCYFKFVLYPNNIPIFTLFRSVKHLVSNAFISSPILSIPFKYFTSIVVVLLLCNYRSSFLSNLAYIISSTDPFFFFAFCSLRVFTVAGIVGIFILLPVNYLGDQLSHDISDLSSNSLDSFSISNVKDGSNWCVSAC